MPRIRSLHPGQWTDENFVELSFAGRLLVIALRNEADDCGLFEWKPTRLKMRLMPNDTLSIQALLAELEAADFIRSFEVEGREYGALRNFCQYQRVRKPSQFCPLPQELKSFVAYDGRTDHQGMTKGCGTIAQPSLLKEGDEKEGDETEGKKETEETGYAGLRPEMADDFDQFWSVYPNRVQKREASRLFAHCVNEIPADQLIEAASHYAEQVKGRAPRFVCSPVTWLKTKRWEDDIPKNPHGLTSEEGGALKGFAHWTAKQRAVFARLIINSPTALPRMITRKDRDALVDHGFLEKQAGRFLEGAALIAAETTQHQGS